MKAIVDDSCKWLHDQLSRLRVFCFPLEIRCLPNNAIYFLYEKGEVWGHGGAVPRIVRIGTHKDGNFKSRIAEHYLLDESKMNFDRNRPAPHERSIFRKNIGRALLNSRKDPYLQVWEIDFTSKACREKSGHLRDVQTEKRIEEEVTQLIREKFSFRFIEIENQSQRMGRHGLESRLIGTVAGCRRCWPSGGWLGSHSPKQQIRESGLRLVHHLQAEPISEEERDTVAQAVRKQAQAPVSRPPENAVEGMPIA